MRRKKRNMEQLGKKKRKKKELKMKKKRRRKTRRMISWISGHYGMAPGGQQLWRGLPCQ